MIGEYEFINGDSLAILRDLPDEYFQCCVTSPPYFGLRDYGVDGQIGLEPTPDEYVARLVEVFREVRRCLRDDGTLWLNLGDSYARNPSKGTTGTPNGRNVPEMKYSGGTGIPTGTKEKDLVGIPWLVAFALRNDGWYLRSDIIWAKPNPMPESVTDRPTRSHEYLFLLTKSKQYYYDHEIVKEEMVSKPMTRNRNNEGYNLSLGDGRNRFSVGARAYGDDGKRNRRSVWTIAPKPFKEAHFAVMPEALVEPCILAGSAPEDFILDPFAGAGTTGLVSIRNGRHFIGIELNPQYIEIADKRLKKECPVIAAQIAS